MAFENLADKLSQTFAKLRGKGKLTESDIKVAMREVKLALLEADVSFKIVKEFIKQEDILYNKKELEKAVKVAKNLIDVSFENMKND